MKLREDWGELALIVGGIASAGYAVVKSEIYFVAVALGLIVAAYSSLKLRGRVRELSGD